MFTHVFVILIITATMSGFDCITAGENSDVASCDKSCTREYNLVCARNSEGLNMTFNNICLFEIHNCKADNDYRVIKFGAC